MSKAPHASEAFPLAHPSAVPVPSLQAGISLIGPEVRHRIRDTGISLIGEAPWGTHFCQFYQTRDDLIEVLVPYFRAGLEDNEFCMWVTSEPLNAEEAQAAIRRAMPDIDLYLERGQLEILSHDEWYTRGGTFDSQRVLNGWLHKLSLALARGFDGLRLTGNTFWLERGDWSGFTDYEAAVNSVIGNYPMMALCTYCLDRCSAHEIIDVIKNHQFALINRDGRWEIIQGEEQKRLSGALVESEARLRRQNAILDGINRVFQEALSCETEEALGRTCLMVAQEVTGSQFGFIGELSADGLLDDIAVSDPGWDACRMQVPSEGGVLPTGLKVHGLYGRVLIDGRSFYTNDPPSHPDSIGLPDGHPRLIAFLGVPLVRAGKVIGMIAMANRPDGYSDEDLAALEALAPAIVQAFARKRSEADREKLLAAEQAARAEADAAVRLRDEFMSVAAHELKTPVTSLMGFSQLLAREYRKTGSLDPKRVVEAADRINDQSRRLTRLVEQLLDASRIEAGKLALSCQETEVSDLVDTVVAAVRHVYPTRSFLVRNSPGIAADLDSLRLEQVLVNLLDNAVKFSPEDEAIEVEVKSYGARDLTISVRDRGPGIPEEKRGHLFERFYQAHTHGQYGGMGIGLYVSRQIIELHGGSITVEQPHDGGSRFVVCLPLRRQS